MPRVIGIDPGTVSIDVCGLEDGRLFLDESLPTGEALASPDAFIARLEAAAPLDLVAGPSGYGLPLVSARDATDADLRLACLAAEGESGGIGGLRALVRALARSALPVVLTPGVIHLASVPAHRKVNRVDMGTADKVCAAALAVHEQAARARCAPREVSCILLELGGAFTAALAIAGGRIVDGIGGSSGPMGVRASGALDGEVAFLAGTVSKAMLFTGGVESIASAPIAREAYIESAVKAVAALAVVVPGVRDLVVSGRMARDATVTQQIQQRLAPAMRGLTLHVLTGFAEVAKQASQGAALIADGLAGGPSAELVDTLGIRDASGTVLDHLHVISPAAARARLGLV